ncbi:T9SS type A sorting domain-containing protein, partial [Candidatus Neomarinimicrobiota bacterium]
GYSVSIYNDIIAIGAHGDNIEEHNEGSVYLFRQDFGGQDNWGQIAKLLAGDREDNDQFGISLSLTKGFLLIGAHGEDTNGEDGGAAYLFYLTPELVDHWWQFKKIIASDGDNSDFFGFSVAVNDKDVVIGAFLEDGSGQDAGAAYILSNEFEVPDTKINLSAIGEDQQVILSWSPSPSSTTQSYYIFRGMNTTELSYLTTVSNSIYQYNDYSVENSITYFYKIFSIDDIGSVNEYSNVIESTPQESTLGTESTNAMPERFNVSQNYPNPFNPVTNFTYSIPAEANVRIIIFDMLGHQIKNIANRLEQPGTKMVTWDATDDDGKTVGGGVYFYQVRAGNNTYTGKMLLLK